MIKIENFLKPNYLKEKPISKNLQKNLNYWAQEAHEIDPSQSISFYYDLFLKRFKKQSASKSEIKNFFGDNVIEN